MKSISSDFPSLLYVATCTLYIATLILKSSFDLKSLTVLTVNSFDRQPLLSVAKYNI